MDGIRVYGDSGIRVTSLEDGIKVYGSPELEKDHGGSTSASTIPGFRYPRSLREHYILGNPLEPVYELSTSILASSKFRKNFKHGDFEMVKSYRNNFDSYSGTRIQELQKPVIDHVVELQCVSFAIAKVMHSSEKTHLDYCLKMLKPCLNILENYNITSSVINICKMNIFKTFIREKIDHGFSILTLLVGSSIEDQMHGIVETFKVSSEIVREKMNNVSFSSSQTCYNHYMRDILDEYDNLISLLKLDDEYYFNKKKY